MIGDTEEEVNNYISNFYDKHATKVKEVMVPDIVNIDVMSESFGLNFIHPQRGTKRKILDLATNNVISIANRNIEEVAVLSKLIYVRVPLPYELKLKEQHKVVNDIVKIIKKDRRPAYLF